MLQRFREPLRVTHVIYNQPALVGFRRGLQFMVVPGQFCVGPHAFIADCGCAVARQKLYLRIVAVEFIEFDLLGGPRN